MILIYNLCGRVIPVSFPLAELQELHKSLFEQRLESIIPGLQERQRAGGSVGRRKGVLIKTKVAGLLPSLKKELYR
ncbi:hypothetical protein CDG79_29725 [Nostoc sp. 'Peltigera membranacea cyanobiont' 232]|nr:hypothetical protein CDG79_29725 [Nostoc sp. 'Peltigera membranacea cyanobiont' 232]